MKAILGFSVAAMLLASCGGGSAGGPGDAVLEMFEALKAGNGERAVSYMSESALAEMDAQIRVLKADPELSSQQLAQFGIEVRAEDIPGMSGRDFAVLMVSSPSVATIMGSAEVTIGDVEIEGDLARVEVTTSVMGRTETNIVDVVMEGGSWKVTEFGVNF